MRSSFLMGLRLAVLLGSLLLFTWAAVGGQGLSFVVVWLDGVGLASLGNALSPTVSAEEQGDKGARKPVLATNAVAAPDPSRPALWLDGPPAPPAPVAVTNPNAPVVLTPIGESVAPPASAPWAQSFAPQQEYAPPTQPASVAPPTHPGFVNPRLANPAAPPQFRSSQLSPSGSASPADRRFGAAPESPEIVTAAGGGSAPTVTPVGYFGESEPTVPLSRAAGRPETGAPPPVVDPAAVRSTPAPFAGSVPADAPSADENARLQALAGELQTLGANFYRLEQCGDAPLFRFQCRVPLAGRPQASRHFQATAESREAAMQRVVEQVRDARTVRP